MLQSIKIQDFILARDIAFELGEGMNVLTGETGAGKTILINALKYGTGENLSKELFDFTLQQPNVELHFQIAEPKNLEWFELEPEREIICQRITKSSGKTMAYINGVHISLPIYKDFCRQLLQIHGQNDTEQLFSVLIQKKLFDRYFSESLKNPIQQIETLRNQYISSRRELARLQEHEQQRERERDFLGFQIHEIEEANLQSGEWEALLEERESLTHRENIKEVLQQAHLFFQSGQTTASLQSQLINLSNQLEACKQYSSDLAVISESIQTILTLLKESERDIERSYDKIISEDSEQRLYSVLSRIDLIKNLQRKFGATVAEILQTKNDLAKQLSALESADERTSQLEEELNTMGRLLADLCSEVSQKRKQLSDSFTQRIEKELEDVGMSAVKMKIEILQEEADQGEDVILVKEKLYRLFTDGIDKLQYLVSTNPGQPFLPMSKIASGGELSRFMLALKSLIGRHENIDTLIFDEIDAGIGGLTANHVGLKCRDLSKDKQIICITHLPQIAAKGHHHFVIEKNVQHNETSISLRRTDLPSRIAEITRMLGEPASEASIQLAKSMLEQE